MNNCSEIGIDNCENCNLRTYDRCRWLKKKTEADHKRCSLWIRRNEKDPIHKVAEAEARAVEQK